MTGAIINTMTMPANIDVQFASEAQSALAPDAEYLCEWAQRALQGQEGELSIRVVDAIESQSLNAQYRDQDRPTNVLSFPAEIPSEWGLSLLGDVVICAEIVQREAAEQSKPIRAHWAHMVVHGVLHLRGFDHIDEAEAEHMEALERDLLALGGIANPYSLAAV